MLSKFFDTLANMGIWIRLNDSRTAPPSEEGRGWGPAVDGFAVSLAIHGADGLSVLIKNLTDSARHAPIPGWLRYFRIEISGPDGLPVPLKSFGEQAMNDPQLSVVSAREFPPGKSIVNEIPLGALYDLRSPGLYKVRVWCPVPDAGASTKLVSNEVTLHSPRL